MLNNLDYMCRVIIAIFVQNVNVANIRKGEAADHPWELLRSSLSCADHCKEAREFCSLQFSSLFRLDIGV